MKRTALKRTAPLRAAPLARSSANTTLARATSLKPRSRKRVAAYVERRRFVAAVLEERPLCEIRWDANCRGRAEGVHETVKRSHGGSILPDARAEAQGQRFVAACHVCNGEVENQPAEARRRGWA